MKIFISGVCGFVGSELALGLRRAGHAVCGCDNFIRPGSQLNQARLEAAGVEFWKGDVRFEKDLERAKGIDWVIDAAANPSVLAGIDGKTSSRELLEHNLWGTVNLLEVCKREHAGLILLSTSRVYSIEALCKLPVKERDGAFVLEESGANFSPAGITEDFSTAAPISLYGVSKLASEQIALEYGSSFGFPVWVNRCGVMAGAGQFGKPDQGIFSFWIHSWAREAPLKYIGFGGTGHQVRDCLHPEDLLDLVLKQLEDK
ncbi:MAG: NAD-dependent epimerase/dehydratase family protein, partial [Chthoniobacterales bacterium]